MRTLITLLSTGCYTGYTPKAPGTAGSILGLGLVWIMSDLALPYYLLATLAFFVLGVWVSSRAEHLFGHEGAEIVIDEVVGIMIVFTGMSLDVITVIAGFFLFRALDIWKPFPCDRMQRLSGGWGVMMDDAIAAVYTNLLLLLMARLIL